MTLETDRTRRSQRGWAGAEQATGLFHPRPREQVLDEMVARSRARFTRLPEPALESVLEDALWHERKRLQTLSRGKKRAEEPEKDHLDELARVLVRGARDERIEAGLKLVRDWTDEIHGRFDPRVYRVATRILPSGLAALLSGRPKRIRDWDLKPDNRLVVKGDLPWLHELAQEATLILAPTHVSNLDSPLVGLSLFFAGLPPFVYGAGLNLFSNPVIGWWMHRLGAYTVDRTKKAELYKDVLKDYSIRALTTRHHSLFFPGGTRCRSGEVEGRLKKGLLGTGIVAWQEMLAAGRPDSEVYVVPLSLSYTQVLEANTLISDFLAEEGKQRFIITDDEFARPRELASFARRILDLDSAVIAHFGDPLDVLGNPVSRDPIERKAQAQRRKGYVTGKDGQVEWDEQRDHAYTGRLSDALVDAFAKYTHPLATHAAAEAAWRAMVEAVGSSDPFKVVRAPIEKRRILPDVLMRHLRAVVDEIRRGARQGRWFDEDLVGNEDQILDAALDRFARYHRSHALVRRGSELVVEDPKLCLYYRNRLTILSRPVRQRPLGEQTP